MGKLFSPYSNMSQPEREDWRDKANCLTTSPDIFFPGRGADTNLLALARLACERCNVLEQCKAWVMATEPSKYRHGFVAGMSPRQREALQKKYPEKYPKVELAVTVYNGPGEDLAEIS